MPRWLHVDDTQTPRGSTRAPRRCHAGAAGRGPPAVAGGELRRPSNRGWARWKEEVVGNLGVAAPPGNDQRSSVGDDVYGGGTRVTAGDAIQGTRKMAKGQGGSPEHGDGEEVDGGTRRGRGGR